MEARGKCEAKRSKSPLEKWNKLRSPEKGVIRTCDISALQALSAVAYHYQGRRAALRFALAPGFYIPRLRRSVITFQANSEGIRRNDGMIRGCAFASLGKYD
jgi:hypothetical protein